MTEASKKEFATLLLEWWLQHKANYPWRKTRNPYSILVAELLLRKTTVKQVEKIYDYFLDAYPTPKELSRATEKELKHLLTPLGMEHTRAKLFKKLAESIVKDNGNVPSTEEELTALPGVGRYSANAVLCMAYGKDVPMVDTNAVRVIQRVFSFKSSKKRAKDDKRLWDFVKDLIPKNESKEFNLAVIDFAHILCSSGNPICCSCPLRRICDFGKTANS